MSKDPTIRTHLRPAELAAAWGVNVKTVYRGIHAGKIEFVQPAGKKGAISIPIASLPQKKVDKGIEVQPSKPRHGKPPRWKSE